LIEKQRTTPNAYPLTLNSVRTACNQASNREPVVDYSESVVQDTLKSLQSSGLVRLIGGAAHRVTKYRQVLDEALGVDDAQISVLAVLMLRGAQTPGEIKQRTERLHAFSSLEAVDAVLDSLVEFSPPLVTPLERQPGRREIRYRQLLGEEADTNALAASPADDAGWPTSQTPSSTAAASSNDAPRQSPYDELVERVALLEETVAKLSAELKSLQEELI
jgi:uncharacterized protein YceH (UPF0502 family)